jgi:hypothetical protein
MCSLLSVPMAVKDCEHLPHQFESSHRELYACIRRSIIMAAVRQSGMQGTAGGGVCQYFVRLFHGLATKDRVNHIMRACCPLAQHTDSGRRL